MIAAAAVSAELLLVTEARGFVHASIPAAVRSVEHLGYRTRVLRDADELTAARLAGAQAVVFLNTSGELGAAPRRRLLAWVRGGGAFVGAHAAADTWPSSRAFDAMLGADFVGHGPPAVRRVRIVDPAFTTQRSFAIHEEFYAFRGRTRTSRDRPPARRRRAGLDAALRTRARVLRRARALRRDLARRTPAAAHGRRAALGHASRPSRRRPRGVSVAGGHGSTMPSYSPNPLRPSS